jgi:FkbM family methyltransferase
MQLIADHNGGDSAGLRSVLASDMYAQWLRKMQLPQEIVIADFGANSGAFPILLKAGGHTLKSALCVEMNTKTFSRLHFNATHNFAPAIVKCVNAALTGTPGKLTLYFGAGSTADSVDACSTQSPGRERAIIDAITLDNAFEKYLPNTIVDICKVDVEGAEYEIFLTQPCKSLRRVRYVLMEVHGVDQPASRHIELIQSFANLDFEEIGRTKTSEHCFVVLLQQTQLQSCEVHTS